MDSGKSDPGTTISGIEDLKPLIESALESACEFGDGCPDVLASAMRYALLAPGKRLRPALVLMAAEACQHWSQSLGSEIQSSGQAASEFLDPAIHTAAMPGAVAVEMIHAYSLIHDDLPAMDDDDLRRGRPTVHVKFDQATAILAGDALQAEAFRHLATRLSDPIRASAAMRTLAEAASANGLVGGQADDLAAEKTPDEANSLEHLESIHRRKTGALFAASLDLGAILAGSDQQSRTVLNRYAADLGLAFQVVDDLLDHTADETALGKRVGKDAGRGKLTYPGLLGLQGAQEKAKELVESAKRHVTVFGAAGWRLTWLADYVLERTH